MTTSDAIALGSMIAALTAACAGLVRGDPARAGGRTEQRASSARRSDLGDLAAAVRDLADVARIAVALAATGERWTETMRDMLDRIDGRPGRP